MRTREKSEQSGLNPRYIWRSARPEDARIIHALRLAIDAAEGTDEAGTLDSLAREFQDTWLLNMQTDTLLGVSADGQLTAFGIIFANPNPTEKRQASLWIDVHPDHRDQGLRRSILIWLEERAQAILCAMDPALPAVIRLGSEDQFTEDIELYQAHGYKPVRYWNRMLRDLRSPIPEDPGLPPGLTMEIYQAKHDKATMNAFNDAFRDHWSFDPVTEQDWALWFTGREDFRPDLSYLALEGNQIVAFCLNGISWEENQRKGIKEGWVHDLGTRRPWRRRGVATALLCKTMHAFKSQGLDFAMLGVDTQNPTGALGLYQRLGFVAVKKYITFEKRLA